MQVLTDDGARVAAVVNGRERRNAVVLIHGFPFSSTIFDMQAEALDGEFCVVRPDLRGAGKSSATDGPYLMEALAADVALLLDALGIERASVAGHSLGGYVALAFARMFTERVERLALVSSRLRADTPQEAQARWELADRVDTAHSIEPAVQAYLPRLLAVQTLKNREEIAEKAYEIARGNNFAGAAATLRGMALRAPSDDIAEDLEVPVLVVAGACDGVLPLEEAAGDARRFPRAEFVVCERSGHLAVMEEPQRVSDALRSWLARAVSE
ncbi:MAG TPA: alpha/beta hydrolase [Candidatus Cybelea sp.]|jgi:pimeloyl-ACP methyl ester carboxylesterase|nr:alpha/beta hydrolase [Candidatus Cybelea sp.]